MCVICVSTGIVVISEQPSQLPQWNSGISIALWLLIHAPRDRDGDKQGPAVLLHTLWCTLRPPVSPSFSSLQSPPLFVSLLMYKQLNQSQKFDLGFIKAASGSFKTVQAVEGVN